MPEYLAPGVYIEEIEMGAKPIEGVSTSTAVFLGQTERGPTEGPVLITSFTQFQRVFGGVVGFSYLPYAVEGFFLNGGRRCFVCRVLGEGAAQSSYADGGTKFFEALSAGSWGNRLLVVARPTEDGTQVESFEIYLISPAAETELDQFMRDESDQAVSYKSWPDTQAEKQEFETKLKRLLGKARTVEKYPYNADLQEKVNANSELLRIEDLPDPLSPGIYRLSGGSEGTVGLNHYTEFFPELEKIEEISLVYAPYNGTLYDHLVPRLIAHCEKLMDRFLVVDSPPGKKPGELSDPRDRWESKYAAYYYPWLRVYDPLTGGLKEVPPGGHVLGVYARTDAQRGVHKAPANEPVRGVVGLSYTVSKGEQEVLNPKGINCIRALPGRGIRIWGARTLSSDALWKYVNVRRLFIFLEKSIERGIQWAVFEPNNPRLWARVRQTISQFLTTVWKDGALFGTAPEEAFFVKCDETTMTQEDIDNGRLVVLVGVAPVKPAEFVIFRIAQWSGGSEVSE